MKAIKIFFLVLLILFVGYLLGGYFPISGFMRSGEQSIAGQAELRVTVLRPDKYPAAGLEVDVATEVGKVLEGGHVNTDANGVAIFKIKPGNYFIFFNALNFPNDLEYRDTHSVIVNEGKIANETIILQARGY